VADLIEEQLAHLEDVRPHLDKLFGLEAQLGKVRRQLFRGKEKKEGVIEREEVEGA
jgi:hypothetical protein